MIQVDDKVDTRKWCWATSEDSEEWYGPFDTRERAIAEASATFSEDEKGTFVISRCNYADVSEAAERWAESLEPLEDMNDNTDQDLQDYDDGETYEYLGDPNEANAQLDSVIVTWAKEHIKTRWFCADGDAMEVIEVKAEKP